MTSHPPSALDAARVIQEIEALELPIDSAYSGMVHALSRGNFKAAESYEYSLRRARKRFDDEAPRLLRAALVLLKRQAESDGRMVNPEPTTR